MGYRLSKIYTKTGDDGSTSLGGDKRFAKDDIRLEVLGTLDELNSMLGMVIAYAPDTVSVQDTLMQVQQDLFNLGGELCPPHQQVMSAEKVSGLEKMIDEWNEDLPPLQEFIMPGGNLKSASCHLARTICRRAERGAVSLKAIENFNPEILRYLNRLSDMLFVAARVLARESEAGEEILWEHEKKVK
jgi:cob(I)alamin adenosyltransferase